MTWLQCLLLLGFGFSWADPTSSVSPTIETTKTALNLPDDCINGPGYWCQNLDSAKECKALPHCIQTVWMHQSFENVDKSSGCQTCLAIITGFQNASSSISIDHLETALEIACDFVPETTVAKVCEKTVKYIVPDMKDYVKHINPTAFCRSVFLCDAITSSQEYFKAKNIKISNPLMHNTPLDQSADSKALAPSSDDSSKAFDCHSCYTLVTTSQKMFKRASRDDVLKKMLEICGEMSSFSDICSVNVISYFPTIYERISATTVDDACHISGVCDSLYHFHEPTLDLQTAIANAPDDTNDEVCDFCLAMVNHLRDIVVANSTEEEFKQVLEGICKQTGNFQEQCLQLVDQYYGVIYQYLIVELDANGVCEKVKLCKPKGIGVVFEQQVPLWPLVPSDINIDQALEKETSKSSLHKVQLSHSESDLTKPLILVGTNKCTWGPSYWCTNMTTSKECGSLKHCIHEVWEKMTLPADNGDICHICKDMVQQARDQLRSNETQEELKEVFEGSCKLIPIKLVTEECIKAVDEFIPELVETLSSQMNPQIVCATVGLCNSQRIDLLVKNYHLKMAHKEIAKKVDQIEAVPLPIDRMFPQIITNVQQQTAERKGTEACEICQMFLHFVQQQITLPKSQAEIEQVVNKLCVKLPKEVSSQCSQFIEVYGSAFISLLAQDIDPSVVCPRIGACTAFLGFIDNVKPTCPMCLMALQALENKIKSNKTEQNIKKALDNLCRGLPQHMAGECERFVNNSSEQIVDSLMAELNPQETCLYLKFCDASHMLNTDEANVDVFNPPITDVKISDVETNEVGESNNDNRCVLCEFIISKLDQELKDKKTAEEIKHAVHTICAHMPKSVKSQCDTFVQQYADVIIDLLAYSLEPEQICSELHLCNNHTSSSEKLQSKVRECVICEAIIGSLQGLISDKHVTQPIRKDLLQACAKLPKNYHDMCVTLVVQLEPQFETISRTIPAHFICSHLKVCDNYYFNFNLLDSKNCIQGPQFWCSSSVNAASCGTSAIQYCQEQVWKGPKPKKNSQILKRFLIISP